MRLDANRMLKNLSQLWAQDLANARQKIAILMEENRVLKEKIEELEGEKKEKAE